MRYADNLLVELKFQEVREAMRKDWLDTIAAFAPLRRELEWEARRHGQTITVTYRKKVYGDPKVGRIIADLEALGADCTSVPGQVGQRVSQVPISQFSLSTELEPAVSNEEGGTFEWRAGASSAGGGQDVLARQLSIWEDQAEVWGCADLALWLSFVPTATDIPPSQTSVFENGAFPTVNNLRVAPSPAS